MCAFRQDFQPPFLVQHRLPAGQQGNALFGEQAVEDSGAQGNPQAARGKNGVEVWRRFPGECFSGEDAEEHTIKIEDGSGKRRVSGQHRLNPNPDGLRSVLQFSELVRKSGHTKLFLSRSEKASNPVREAAAAGRGSVLRAAQ